jgi:uncharacterized alkaline shock family protein YloU
MPNIENTNVLEEGIGAVHISEEVIAVIAALATSEVKGVVGAMGHVASGLPELWGKRNVGKGIKVVFEEDNKVSIDAFIIVDYGCEIPQVAKQLQEKIKNQVETMTGVIVETVNIHIQGVNTETASKEEI